MRRQIMTALLALVVTLGLATAVSLLTTTPAQAAVSCTHYYSTDYRYVKQDIPLHTDPVWRVMQETRYRNCHEGTRYWVDPLWSKVGCREHNDAARDNANLRHVNFNTRLFDKDGHEVNPGEWRIECRSKKWTTETHNHDGMTKLHKCAAGPPQWSTSVHLDLSLDSDIHSRLGSTMWGFTGPHAINC